jgi:TRAP-type transport system small permease protein
MVGFGALFPTDKTELQTIYRGGSPLARLPAPVRWLIQVERGISVLLLALLAGLMAAQVAARYLFGSPIAWSEELARFVLIWLGFMGAAFVMGEGRHITVDVVSRVLSRKGRLAVECFSSVVVILSCAMLVPAGIDFSMRMGSVKSPALEIPMSWWYWAAAAGFVLLALQNFFNLILAFRRGAPIWDQPHGQEDLPMRTGGAA